MVLDEERGDRDTCAHILQLDTHIRTDQACGAYPVNGLLRAAQAHGLVATTVDLRNSGDTSGARDSVVGYGTYAFH